MCHSHDVTLFVYGMMRLHVLQPHLPPSGPDPPVCDDVDHDHDAPKNDLSGASQANRVQKRQQIPFDEIALIPGVPRSVTQPVLPGRQRTDGARQLNPNTPDHCRQVHPREARPVPHGWPTQHHEADEGEMESDDQVCQQRIQHVSDQP